MNYYGPRQVDPGAARPDAGLWRYTVRNDAEVRPVGYCAQGCAGHATAGGAMDHQREYELDEAVRLGPITTDPWAPCEALVAENVDTGEQLLCGQRTPHAYAMGPGLRIVGGPHLCDRHQTREDLALAWEGPGDVTSSF